MPAKRKVQANFPQSKNPILPRLPCRLLALGPSGSGKSSLIVKLITDPNLWRGKFSKIFWISPTSSLDDSLEELRDYVATIGQDQEKDPTFQDDLSPAFIEKIMMKNKEVNQHQKDEGRSQRFSSWRNGDSSHRLRR